MNSDRFGQLNLPGRLLLPAFVSLLFSSAIHAQPSADDFIRESDYLMAAISPNGQYLAELWNQHADNTRIVSIRDLSKPGNPIVGKLTDRVVRPRYVTWANDERLLVNVSVPYNMTEVAADSRTKPDFDIYDYPLFSRTIAVNVDAGNPVTLLEDQMRASRNITVSHISHYLPDDPNHILMLSIQADRLVQFKVNVYTGASQKIASGVKSTFSFVNDADGRPLYRLDYRQAVKRIEIWELKDEAWQLVEKIELNSEEDEAEISNGELIGLRRDELVYRKKNEATGFQELWTLNRETRQFKTLVSLNDRDVLYPVSNLRTNEVVGYAVDGDVIRYRFFDAADQEKYDKLALLVGDYGFSFLSASKDGNLAVVETYGQDNPSAFYLYNFRENTLSFLQNGYFPLAGENLSLPATAQFKARDGLVIHTFILLPKDYSAGKKYPLVVVPHGGPQARDRADYDPFAQFVSTRGYIVIQPNFRGSTGYGKEFEEAGYKQWGGKMQDDLEDAVNFMVAKGYADPGKVCIAGFSYGGYAALMGVIKTPELYQCAISLNGVTDLPEQIKYDQKVLEEDELIEKYVHARIGNPDTDRESLELRSPARQADKIRVPLLIVAGTADAIVPFDQAKKLTKALKKHKKQYEFLELEDTGHNPIYYTEDAVKVYAAVEKFLARHLQAVEPVN